MVPAGSNPQSQGELRNSRRIGPFSQPSRHRHTDPHRNVSFAALRGECNQGVPSCQSGASRNSKREDYANGGRRIPAVIVPCKSARVALASREDLLNGLAVHLGNDRLLKEPAPQKIVPHPGVNGFPRRAKIADNISLYLLLRARGCWGMGFQR